MRKTMIIILLALSFGSIRTVQAQSTEVVQLILNVEKLAQLKGILKDMKRGYDVLHGGYSTIKDISQGNFNLHKLFLDALLEASPTVKRYYKVPKVISYQIALMREHRKALDRFRQSGKFSPEELSYFGRVYSNLLDQSLRNLDELASVVTSGKLRMSDDERLKAIDRIYADMEEKVLFLKGFNSHATLLAMQREREQQDIERTRVINDLK